jgi:hypothetical protein
MSDTQYRIVMDLFHEYHEAFLTLSHEIQTAFYVRLMSR